MKCPYCFHPKTKVIDKRNTEDLASIRRRRECLVCEKRFTTFERIELLNTSIIKKDGRRESFNRDKIIKGLFTACEKRPISRDSIEKIANYIESQLKSLDKQEIESSRIGELIMEKLIELDKIAYIRFASVYREFEDLKSFKKELNSLMKKT
jgi:transcriptional repressor NrdR